MKEKYKVLFVGYGSIAKRHISNLLKIGRSNKIDFEIDLLRSGMSHSVLFDHQEYIHQVFYCIDDIDDIYNIAFITNPTSLHYDTIEKICKKTFHMFIEKPVFDSPDLYDKFIALDRPEGAEYYVACPMRYTNVIRYLKENVDFSKIYGVRCICSSYLPEWRPGTDYRLSYSANKEMGGGVAIDLIHEWDYITYFMGFPKSVKSILGTFSNLEINSEDLAIYIGEYENQFVELHLDYFGRESIRKIEIFTESDTIVGDMIKNEIIYMKSGNVVRVPEDRDEYQSRELWYFLQVINGQTENMNTVENACRVLALAK